MDAARRRSGKQALDQSACRNRWPDERSGVVRTARPLSKADRSRKDPTRAAPRCVKARFLPPRDGVASRADAVGALPARNATAPRTTGRLVVGPIRERTSP
jgi:hypothetical protein